MTDGGKRGKPRAGFPSFTTVLGNRCRDSHIPAAPGGAVEKWKSKNRIPTFPPHESISQIQPEKETQRNRSLRLLQAHSSIRKCSIGKKVPERNYSEVFANLTT